MCICVHVHTCVCKKEVELSACIHLSKFDYEICPLDYLDGLYCP